jgi:hypothetical protein
MSSDRIPNKDCPYCGRLAISRKPSIREMILNVFCACLLLAILLPLGYGLSQWLMNECQHATDHLFWHEPLQEWNP